jgi:hypothetical protein
LNISVVQECEPNLSYISFDMYFLGDEVGTIK